MAQTRVDKSSHQTHYRLSPRFDQIKHEPKHCLIKKTTTKKKQRVLKARWAKCTWLKTYLVFCFSCCFFLGLTWLTLIASHIITTLTLPAALPCFFAKLCVKWAGFCFGSFFWIFFVSLASTHGLSFAQTAELVLVSKACWFDSVTGWQNRWRIGRNVAECRMCWCETRWDVFFSPVKKRGGVEWSLIN